ncbi:ergothioneine biosynthesis protein EgtB [Pseudoalteromonas luteoviolacea]|uniref:ergothioneine biosynthesis protein EgtB n=1 Tax=Pseudoalteromonas luteoviolacea TaxID=43657 RepID=UPI00114F0095|nr:ergothioneine biosynthesis protein EgtB [Pseudoalteromonas luteoviolacea]TQF70586.1 ergothioneine biosynthesis protein EgtB [Pseudoalteromonas luteoviolacea]
MNWQKLSSTEKSKYFIDEYLKIREYSTALCSRLEIEDYTVQPIADVSPPKWHLGHTTWFFEEIILVKCLSEYTRFHQQYRFLFNSYYKSAGQHWKQSQRGELSRPTVEEVIRYRSYVDNFMVNYLSSAEIGDDVWSLLEIGLHHEQQHQELLLMDIKFILGCNPISPVFSEKPLGLASPVNHTWRSFNEGIYSVGASDGGFSYDNEKPRHKNYIHSFAISENTVTNGDYLAFIDCGGYGKAEFWLSLGWEWVNDNQIGHPLYWRKIDNKWYEFTLHGLNLLDLNAPVTHVSYFEADAYAKWKGTRLPDEQEMEVYLASGINNSADELEHEKKQDDEAGVYHPIKGDAQTGQVWCWSKSHYSGYPGYRPYQGMLTEYNGKFMCNQFVLRGGCIATPRSHYRHSYRNFYAPHQRWMFSGIRLAKDI